jgi:hypothetical protein
MADCEWCLCPIVGKPLAYFDPSAEDPEFFSPVCRPCYKIALRDDPPGPSRKNKRKAEPVIGPAMPGKVIKAELEATRTSHMSPTIMYRRRVWKLFDDLREKYGHHNYPFGLIGEVWQHYRYNSMPQSHCIVHVP